MLPAPPISSPLPNFRLPPAHLIALSPRRAPPPCARQSVSTGAAQLGGHVGAAPAARGGPRPARAAGKSPDKLKAAASFLMKVFGAIAGKGPKKVGSLYVACQLFKIYFKLGTLNLSKSIIRVIDSSKGFDDYPARDQVTYKYYTGRLDVFNDAFLLVCARTCTTPPFSRSSTPHLTTVLSPLASMLPLALPRHALALPLPPYHPHHHTIPTTIPSPPPYHPHHHTIPTTIPSPPPYHPHHPCRPNCPYNPTTRAMCLQADEKLGFALRRCHRSRPSNIRSALRSPRVSPPFNFRLSRILRYLIPVRLSLGHLPSPELLRNHHLQEVLPYPPPLALRDVRLLRDTLSANEDRCVPCPATHCHSPHSLLSPLLSLSWRCPFPDPPHKPHSLLCHVPSFLPSTLLTHSTPSLSPIGTPFPFVPAYAPHRLPLSRFLRAGVYLLLEKLELHVYRRLIRKIHVLQRAKDPSRAHQVRLEVVVRALAGRGEAVDVDELEGLVATLIALGFVKGYLSHKSKVVVLSKQDPFPRLTGRVLL
ncbi:unnamed protein product [Closterium sp. Naga37s-1]|nr:unnamed protein product [Closterium sp. Naga37s-1]